MTDRQLHILLDTLRSELAQTIEESEQLFSIHGVERSKKIVARGNGGQVLTSLAAIGATLRGEAVYSTEEDPCGRFVALAPLDELLQDWERRIAALLPTEEETE